MKRLFINDLIAWKKDRNRKPLILRGARQVGKTFILQEFGRSYFPQYHYLNFEREENLSQVFEQNLDPKRIIHELSLHLHQKIDIHKDLVIFDEIQALPKALTSLKYFNEEMPELALCTAGSLLGVHLSKASFPVGKVDMLTMYPMSFEEFLMAKGDDRYLTALLQISKDLHGKKINKIDLHIPEIAHEYLWNQLKLYFVVGGLPEAVKIYIEEKENLFESLQRVRLKQEQLIIAYNADMAKHCGNVNAMHIDRIWKSIPAQFAQSPDGSAHKFKFKGVIPGVSRYDRLVNGIDWLEAAGLIIREPIVNTAKVPLSAYTKENTFKLFSFDVGILGALSGLPPEVILNYDYESYKGYFAENYVAQEFIFTGHKIFSWEEGEAEVEFLIEDGGEITPVEVKSGWVTNAKSLQSYRFKYNPSYQVILSAKNIHLDKISHTYLLPLYLAGLL